MTDPADKDKEMDHIRKVLSISGYSKWAWRAPGHKKLTPHPATKDRPRVKGHVTLPYMGGVSEAITRKMRKRGIVVHQKPHVTLRSLLVAPKDNSPRARADLFMCLGAKGLTLVSDSKYTVV